MANTVLSDVFADVLEATAGERPALLAAVRRDHPDWVEPLEQLVAAAARLPATAAMRQALLEEPRPLPPGAQVGPYVIDGEIARGGMGVVYRAHDPALQMDVALKALRPGVAAGPRELERLRDEARTLARLSDSPHIARVHAFLEEDGHGFIVQELVRGQTLRERLATGPLATAEVLRIGRGILDALAAAHRAGIVHRDLKPENVMCTPEGGVKVLDFGIALRDEAPAASTAGPGRALAGTLGYMAPEQLLGQAVDARADVFAVGVVLYELLTGRHPFGSSEDGRWSAILVQPPAPLSEAERARIPEWLLDAIARCLRKVAAERWADVGALAAALAEAGPAIADAGGHVPDPVESHAVAAAQPAIAWWQFHQVAAALVAWLLLVPAWHVRDRMVVIEWHIVFTVLLVALTVAPSLRLSVAFVAAMHPRRVRAHLARVGSLIRAGEIVFSGGLVLIGADLLRHDAGWATLFIAFGLGLVVVGTFVEPVTEQAALEAIDAAGSDS